MLNQLVLVSQTPQVLMPELVRVTAAIQRQLTDELPRAWGYSATINAVERVEDTPLGAAPIIVRDSVGADDDLFGYHRVQENNPQTSTDDQPYALVKFAPQVWSFDASHEALEMVIDPFGKSLHRAPSPNGDRLLDYLVEICDPCGRANAGYVIGDVLVSDFVTKFYYDEPGQPGRAYTAQRRLTAPLQLLEGGYVAWAEPTTSGVIGAGDWRMAVYGESTSREIDRPDIFASYREAVDTASREYVVEHASAKETRFALGLCLREGRRRHQLLGVERRRAARRIKKHISSLV